MNNDLVIKKVERYYQQYLEQESEIIANGFTDFFFERLNAIPMCNKILEELCDSPRIPISVFKEREVESIDEFIWDLQNKGEKYYVSYCYQYYLFLREEKLNKRINYKEYYYDDVLWTENQGINAKEKYLLFKKGFVRPIIDYVLDNLTNEAYILHILERYKSRVERFKSLSYLNTHLIGEKDLQKDLALYLFDNQLVFSKEDDTSNGKLDFLISPSPNDIPYGSVLDCNEKPYIVEVKYFKDKEDIPKLKDSIKQLSVYLGQKPSYGSLLIFTTDETDFDYPDKIGSINIVDIFIGEKYPSQRKSNRLPINFR